MDDWLTSMPIMAALQVVGWPIACLIFGTIPEPWRQRAMSALVAMAGGVYLAGPLGLWEVPLAILVVLPAVVGQQRYPWIGVAWLAHAAVDLAHHFLARPVIPEFPLFSFGCAVIDPLLALWFFAGAPPVPALLSGWRAGSPR